LCIPLDARVGLYLGEIHGYGGHGRGGSRGRGGGGHRGDRCNFLGRGQIGDGGRLRRRGDGRGGGDLRCVGRVLGILGAGADQNREQKARGKG